MRCTIIITRYNNKSSNIKGWRNIGQYLSTDDQSSEIRNVIFIAFKYLFRNILRSVVVSSERHPSTSYSRGSYTAPTWTTLRRPRGHNCREHSATDDRVAGQSTIAAAGTYLVPLRVRRTFFKSFPRHYRRRFFSLHTTHGRPDSLRTGTSGNVFQMRVQIRRVNSTALKCVIEYFPLNVIRTPIQTPR